MTELVEGELFCRSDPTTKWERLVEEEDAWNLMQLLFFYELDDSLNGRPENIANKAH